AMAMSPLAHWRSTDMPATVTGNPARRAAWRPMFIAVLPCCRAAPTTTSSTCSPSTPERSTACRTACPMSSWAWVSLKAPRYARPMGVRAVETMTASRMVTPGGSKGVGRLWSTRGQVHESREVGSVPVRGAEGQLVGLGPLEADVHGRLPGHADAAVQLEGLLGRPDGRVGAEGLGDGLGDPQLLLGVVVRERAGRLTGGGLGAHEEQVEVGQAVLDRLEGPDRSGELHAFLGVLHRRL